MHAHHAVNATSQSTAAKKVRVVICRSQISQHLCLHIGGTRTLKIYLAGVLLILLPVSLTFYHSVLSLHLVCTWFILLTPPLSSSVINSHVFR